MDMPTIDRPEQERSAGKWLQITERDLDFPFDSEGAPHATGRTWLIPVAAVTAIAVEPESSRGDRVLVHVRGRKRPIAACRSIEYLADELGLTFECGD